MSQGTNGFDPYLKWLEIPPGPRPPDHYALLGLPRFESDTKQIEEAARERMKRVREYHIGPHSDQCQELLNDIAKAKVCLINAKTKDPYDEQLRLSSLSHAGRSAEVPDAAAISQPVPGPVVSFAPSPTAPQPRRPEVATRRTLAGKPPASIMKQLQANPWLAGLAGAGLGALLTLLIFLAIQSRDSATPDQTSYRSAPAAGEGASSQSSPSESPFGAGDSNAPPPDQTPERSASAAGDGTSSQPSPSEETPLAAENGTAPRPDQTPEPSALADGEGTSSQPSRSEPPLAAEDGTAPLPDQIAEQSVPAAGDTSSPEPSQTPSPAVATPDAIVDDAPLPANLLDLEDVEKHHVMGLWEQDEKGIRNVDALPNARVVVPVVVTGSYDLIVKFTRQRGNNSIQVCLPIAGRSVELCIAGWPQFGGISGLNEVDGDEVVSNETRTGFNFQNGRPHTLIAKVRQRQDGTVIIDVDFNGGDLFSWEGDSSRLSIAPEKLMPDPSLPGLGCHNCIMSFHSLKVEPAPGDGRFVQGKVERITEVNVPGFQRLDRSPHADAISWRDNWYLFTTEGKSLPDAMVFAREHGGRLMLVSSDEENQFLVQDLAAGLNGDEMPFLGLTRQGNSLNWLTETLEVRRPGVGFQRWAHDQPEFGGEAGVAVSPDGLWHDVGTHESRRRVCVEWGPELPLAGAGEP